MPHKYYLLQKWSHYNYQGLLKIPEPLYIIKGSKMQLDICIGVLIGREMQKFGASEV